MVGDPLQGGIDIDEIRRSGRTPRANVSLLPGNSRKFAASIGEHFRRGIDANDLGLGEGIGEDPGQVAGAGAEIIDCGVSKLGDAREKIEARAKADISVSKVSLRLPSGHRGQPKSYHCRSAKLRTAKSDEKSLRAIELHHFQAVLSADLMFHAIEVILDGLFGK